MKKPVQILILSGLLLTFTLSKTINVMQDTKEIWKSVRGNEFYEVSNLGRVRSLDRQIPFHNVHEKKISLRLKKGLVRVLDVDRYGYNRLRFTSKGKYLCVHRLVCEAFIPNPNNLPSINHKNGIKTDNRVENLEWCTVSQNTKHAFDTGLRSKYWGANAHLS